MSPATSCGSYIRAQLCKVSQVTHPNDLSLPLHGDAWEGHVGGAQPCIGPEFLLGREERRLLIARA